MRSRVLIAIVASMVFSVLNSWAQPGVNEYNEYKGKIVDGTNNQPLSYCNVLVSGINIATVTNSDGEFSIKIPIQEKESYLIIKHIGYKNKNVSIQQLEAQKGLIRVEPATFQLPQIDVLTQDADLLVQAMFLKIPENYPQHEMFMTAFYRESIRRGRSYVTLSEAVVDIQKQPYRGFRNDMAKLYKSRKQADYTKLDTLVFKLMGGPYSNLLLDVMKHPVNLFSEEIFTNYHFTFETIEWMDNRLIYVVKFEANPGKEEIALYKGKLFIDAENMALKSAIFSFNIDNKTEAARMFIKKKPFNAKVTPTEANYRIDYVEKNGQWHYAHSRIELGVKVNWKRRIFNTNYYSTIEMAITDWEKSSDSKAIRFRERLQSNIIISETAEGFSDPDFWGAHNVIEPEKSIENAIRKIQR